MARTLSGEIQPVHTFAEGKSINPQWNPDGQRLYFLSDRDGITNVYTVTVAETNIDCRNAS